MIRIRIQRTTLRTIWLMADARAGAPAPHGHVEFLFGAALQGLPGFERRVTVRGQRCQDPRAIGEKQGVTHVEENETAFGHESILPNRRERARPLTIRLPVLIRPVKRDLEKM